MLVIVRVYILYFPLWFAATATAAILLLLSYNLYSCYSTCPYSLTGLPVGPALQPTQPRRAAARLRDERALVVLRAGAGAVRPAGPLGAAHLRTGTAAARPSLHGPQGARLCGALSGGPAGR